MEVLLIRYNNSKFSSNISEMRKLKKEIDNQKVKLRDYSKTIDQLSPDSGFSLESLYNRDTFSSFKDQIMVVYITFLSTRTKTFVEQEIFSGGSLINKFK